MDFSHLMGGDFIFSDGRQNLEGFFLHNLLRRNNSIFSGVFVFWQGGAAVVWDWFVFLRYAKSILKVMSD